MVHGLRLYFFCLGIGINPPHKYYSFLSVNTLAWVGGSVSDFTWLYMILYFDFGYDYYVLGPIFTSSSICCECYFPSMWRFCTCRSCLLRRCKKTFFTFFIIFIKNVFFNVFIFETFFLFSNAQNFNSSKPVNLLHKTTFK